MKPYYEHAGITIYHGDCREILPTLPKFDLLLTDPPYGIGFVHGDGGGCLASSTRFNRIAIEGDDKPFDPSPILGIAKETVLWGANHFASRLPDSPCWLVWDKRDGMGPNDQADCELAWTSLSSPARLMRHYWNGMLKASEKGVPRVHPTQKPIALMKWCLSMFPDAKTVLDPFCGSGTTLVAAKAMGLTATGIELHEPYCEIVAKRLSQEVFNFGEEQAYRE
jgi:site-specific DNA-methyltransferase (adenine-specific)